MKKVISFAVTASMALALAPAPASAFPARKPIGPIFVGIREASDGTRGGGGMRSEILPDAGPRFPEQGTSGKALRCTGSRSDPATGLIETFTLVGNSAVYSLTEQSGLIVAGYTFSPKSDDEPKNEILLVSDHSASPARQGRLILASGPGEVSRFILEETLEIDVTCSAAGGSVELRFPQSP